MITTNIYLISSNGCIRSFILVIKVGFYRCFDRGDDVSFLEKEKRFAVFKENLNRIEEYNEREEGTAIYGITHLSDLNGLLFLFRNSFVFVLLNFVAQEFTQYHLNERLSSAKHSLQSPLSAKDPLTVTPDAFDWRNLSAVTDVKNQVRRFYVHRSLKKYFLRSGSMWFLLGI